MIDTKPQIQEAQRTNRIKNPQKIYTQEYHSQTAKKTKTEKNLERQRKKQHSTYREASKDKN